jgi:hypothetical protein
MSSIQEPATAGEWEGPTYSESPFAESPFFERESEPRAPSTPQSLGFLPWAENMSPFAETSPGTPASESDLALAEAFTELRDESFDEALSELIAETEDVVTQRFSEETPASAGPEKERLAYSHLDPIRFEAEQYLERLSGGLAGVDLESLDDVRLAEVLGRYDPVAPQVSPAGEDFLKAITRKARSVVGSVLNKAKAVAASVAGPVVAAALGRLKGLIDPLLKRVLSFAIGRLPEPLRAPARLLASKITSEIVEGEAEAEGEDFASSPAQGTDPEFLAESFDAALAEAMLSAHGTSPELESLAGEQYQDEQEGPVESRELEALAEARGALIDTLKQARDGDNLAPAVEQFVPALLGALRVGINLVGRPRVVNFLAGYLGKLISRWVGPQVSGPLSKAIVDTGLRLVTLEQPEYERDDEAVPAMLAATIEDTVRRLAESEDYVLEDEDLMHLATAEAFERAVATNFPPNYVRPGARRAPSIGGRFVARRPRSARPYRRFNRMPEVELTAPIAERISTFGGVTLAAALRAAGATFPLKVRVHIFEATVGTSLRRIAAIERGRRGGGRISSTRLHPLTPAVAGLLLREPGLGVRVGPAYLRSRQRVAAGQRFYFLELLTGAGIPVPGTGKTAPGTGVASQGWIVVDTTQSRIVVALYFSETDAQRVASGTRAGRPAAVLLPALTAAYDSAAQSFGSPSGRVRIVKELEEGEELLGPVAGRMMPMLISALRRALRSWLLPLLSEWVRSRSAEFVQAAAAPANGVTVTVTLTGVPGMAVVRDALRSSLGAGTLQSVASGSAFRGTPSGTIIVKPGKQRP